MSSPDTPTADSCRGVHIAKYELLVHLATGGMGAVYRARDTESGGEVALKVLTPEAASKPALVVRFEREARNASKLRHENIVSVFDSGMDSATGMRFMAMEFVEGKDLHDHIEAHGQLDPEEARQILIQAARALVHAHTHGIVHRDIKPSNFLLTHKKGRLVVKLTDLGLSREVDNDEFRVTRSGTTVGTVDYISPEQAKDSGAADVRSDLYSLGCTGFHMLTGRPPFSEGGLAERLVKHMTQDAPDVRRFNPRVSPDLAGILARLLAKKPSQRFQTPADLVTALLETPALARASQRDTVSDVAAPRAPSGGKKAVRRKSSSSKTPVETAPRGHKVLLLAAVCGVLALVVVGCLVYVFSRGDKTPPPRADPVVALPVPAVSPPTPPRIVDVPRVREPVKVDKQPTWPPLTPGARPLESARADQLRGGFQSPVAGLDTLAANALAFRVSRVPGTGTEKTFPTLAAAVAAVPEDGSAIIEIHDNGPLFDPGVRTSRRNLIIRAGAGFHPLLVWDVARAIEERKKNPLPPGETRPLAFLEVQQGLLALHGCEVALNWPEAAATGSKRAYLTHVLDGDLALRDCTLSALGGPEEGLVVAGVQDQRPRGPRCLLERCYTRGNNLSALEVRAATAEVLLDRCLLVGGDQALVRVQAGIVPEHPVTVRALRSTLVAGRTLLRVEAEKTGGSPAFCWSSWDALLTHTGKEGGGELLSLADGANPATLKWDASNCLYAGWDRLVSGAKTVLSGDEVGWRTFWGGTALTDHFESRSWPVALARPERQPGTAYRIEHEQPVAFAATGAVDQPLGCDLSALSPARESWPGLLEPFVLPLPEADLDAAPVGQGAYPGETVDLTRTPAPNLAELLEKAGPLAPGSRVVFRLKGVPTGPVATGPLKMPRGTSLVLYFDPPAKRDAPPVILQFARPTGDGEMPAAWIEMEGGDLDIVNGELRLPHPPPGVRAPAYLLKVSGGNLRLTRSRLIGPQPEAANGARALIALEGSGETDVEKAFVCCLTDSVVAGGQDGIDLHGVGARLVARSSLLVSGGDAVAVDPRSAFRGATNVQVQFTDTTVAARRAVVRVPDLPAEIILTDPVRVQSKKSAFIGAFLRTDKPCLLAVEEKALTHGVVLWQGESDALDSRLGAAVSLAPGPTLPLADWSRLWGPLGLAHPLSTSWAMPEWRLEGERALDGKPWPLERLQLPLAIRKSAGANFERFPGIVKRP